MPRNKSDMSEFAKQHILKKIRDFELMTGDCISDLELSKELDMSRTPIREAMAYLVNSGILEKVKTKTVVKAITLTDIMEIIEVREAIECKAVELIISKKLLSEKRKIKLLSIQEKFNTTIHNGNLDCNFDLDNDFHKILVQYSNNNRLVDISKRVSLQSQRLRWFSMLTPGRYFNAINEHNEIIKSIVEEDEEKAIKSVRDHLGNTLKNYIDILNTPQLGKLANEIKRMRQTMQ